MKRWLLSLLAVLFIPVQGWGQTTVLQGGSWTAGRLPMYSASGGGTQPTVQQSAPASGGAQSISEISLIARGSGSAPYVGRGTGYLGSIFCLYDGPTTGAYHQLCLSPNATGSQGLISYNAFNGAANQSFNMVLNGTTYQFPFVLPGTGVIGPATTTIGDLACWANTTGTLLSDCTTPPYTNILNLKAQGAACDGVTNDAVIIQATINTAITTGAAVFVPPGPGCVSNAQIVSSVGNTQNVTIFGEGHASRFIFTNASSGGFNFNMGGYASESVGKAILRDFRISAASANTSQAAIRLSWDAYTANAQQSYLVHNIVVDQTVFGSFKFAKGLHINQSYNGLINRFSFIGATSQADDGIYINHSINHTIIAADITYATNAIHGTTGDAGAQVPSEGLMIVEAQTYNVTKCLTISGNSTDPTVNFIDISVQQMSCSNRDRGAVPAIDMTKVQQARIVNSLFYTDALAPAIDVTTFGTSVISGNTILNNGAGASNGIRLSGASNNNTISNNVIAGFGTCLLFNDVNTTGNIYSGNDFMNCTVAGVTDNAATPNGGSGNCTTAAGITTGCYYAGGMNITGNVNLSAGTLRLNGAPFYQTCNIATLPTSANTTWYFCANYSASSGEVNFFNVQNNANGFDWYQKTGAGTAVQLASLNYTDSKGAFFTGALKLTPVTVAQLPTCNAGHLGQIYTVSDANAPVYATNIAGGGAVYALALCDGTNWQAH